MTWNALVAGLTTGVLAVALGPPVATAAAPPPRKPIRVCALLPLPLPADMNGRALAVDPTGRYIAGLGYRVTDDDQHPLLLLWDAAPLHHGPGAWNQPHLTIVATDAAQVLHDINRHGVVIGGGLVDNVHKPWRYRDGQLEWLPTLTDTTTSAVGINSRGDIVGSVAVEETETTLPLLWPADRPGTVDVIGAPPNSGAGEILDDGTIVGGSGGSSNSTAFGWVRRPDGRIDRLTAPGTRWTAATAAAGTWAAGPVGTGPAEEDVAVMRWNLRTGVPIPANPTLRYVQDVNARGTILGDRAVDHDGRLVALAGALPNPLNSIAWAIADDGLVVGSTNDSRWRPARWINC
ncbi:hypothetical protein V6V47_24335 [Micromonospora sp. CPCC 205539]|uniref:hypothetical protein n=1 Tax=Micromonospora sp. CPCC 205539 TaxID=3122408 RepID=UPI002FF190E6